ncbi:splicing regulatory glutamine/lysine-rich protein 1-like isoform X2 [Lytechinus pictus]|uniref:splicing regulatory glutamine/lysine-rich protein 1-like isoform X2 n=1 Tax=Lytechinus pictus TaxID=7653 RepID=UPI0030B9BDF6
MVVTKVAQVNNVSSTATLEQVRSLFSFLGKIEDIRLFPKEDSVLPVTARICFILFEDPTSVGMAQHLTNTVFIDRPLQVSPFAEGSMPEESKALQMVASLTGGLGGSIPSLVANTPVSTAVASGAGLLPTPPQPLMSQITQPPAALAAVAAVGAGDSLSLLGDSFSALGVPQPPPLNNVDPSKVEEIRRTIYVGNLDSATVLAEQLLTFFQQVGEVKYVRMAGDETQPTRFAFVEFTDQASVAKALTHNGVMFAGRPIKINHSNNAIVKPPGKTQEAIQRELAETMKQVRDAQALIQAAIDPAVVAAEDKDEKKDKKRSPSPSRRRRSRSRSRRRSRSRSPRRSHSRRRSRSWTPPPRRRSRSPRRRRSRTPPRRSRTPPPRRRRSRTRSPPPPPRRRRSRSKSRDKRSRSRDRRRPKSRTPPRSYSSRRRSRSKSRDRSRSHSPIRRRRSPSRSPPPPPRRRSRTRSPPIRIKRRSRSRSPIPIRRRHSPSRSISPPKRRSRSGSRSPPRK